MSPRSARPHPVDVDRVLDVLTDTFGWDEVTLTICRAQLTHADYANGYGSWFEFICDDPTAANWRLKPDRAAGPWGLRLAYYGANPDQRARAEAITRRLRAGGNR